MSLYSVIKPKGPPTLLGWYRIRGSSGAWSKYHASLSNVPENYRRHGYSSPFMRDACGWGWIESSVDYVMTPPIEKCCKRCLKQLEKLGLVNKQ